MACSLLESQDDAIREWSKKTIRMMGISLIPLSEFAWERVLLTTTSDTFPIRIRSLMNEMGHGDLESVGPRHFRWRRLPDVFNRARS